MTHEAELRTTSPAVKLPVQPTNSLLIIFRWVPGKETRQGTFLVKSLGRDLRVNKQSLTKSEPLSTTTMVFIFGLILISLIQETLGFL
jgi:hypothetical protein